MLRLNKVTFYYPGRRGKRKLALQEVDLCFEPGHVYAIYGPSGSGKTTCLSLLGALDVPMEGTVELDGVPLSEIGGNELRRSKVAYIFQDFKLFPYMTAVENVLTALHIARPELEKEEAKSLAVARLTEVGLTEDEQNRRVTRLSGGQQQRVAIARALVTDATYLLADEPTGNLDGDNAERVFAILSNLAHEYNKCVIVVTHSKVVRDAADFRFLLKDGRVELLNHQGVMP